MRGMRVTIWDLRKMKERGEKIPMLTAYDYPTARFLDEAGIPAILVGDSLGMVVLGYESTVQVTMEDMLHHTKAVARGAKRALIIADMPFMSYHISPSQALENAARLVREGGAQAVKIEGGEEVAETAFKIVRSGIPVMGHIGFTPQSIHQLGGFKVVGKTREAAAKLLSDARALEEAGVFAVVLECVPAQLAELITQRLGIPTIGIGSGAGCDGQIQVVSDILGLYPDFVPKHAKQYFKMGEIIRKAAAEYIEEVKKGAFPTEKESFFIDEALLEGL